MNRELRIFALLAACFAAFWFAPVDAPRFTGALIESVRLARWYARTHVLFGVVPALFMAGAIAVFVRRDAVIRCLGPGANRALAYGAASVCGAILSACSCTVLPLFAGILSRGAGLGPAAAFLYSGPAINVLAVLLTARVLGWRLGLARGTAAVLLSIAIGLAMQFLFRRAEPAASPPASPPPESAAERPWWKTALLFAAMAGALAFANWSRSGDVRAVFLCCPDGLQVYEVRGVLAGQSESALRVVDENGRQHAIPRAQLRSVTPLHPGAAAPALYRLRRPFAACAGLAVALMLVNWFRRAELREWLAETWGFSRRILPLLLVGVLLAGFFLGSPDRPDGGLVPARWVRALVGDSPAPLLPLLGADQPAPRWLEMLWPLWTNLFASVFGVLMYFSTLTEVPIVRGLMDGGMGRGPALALLLSGPALSLPSILTLGGILGFRKTAAYVALVALFSAAAGLLFGLLPPA